MKVLIVSSGNSGNVIPFVKQQSESLIKYGVEIDHFSILGHGIMGYLGNLNALKNTLSKANYDLVHAHFGLSGALAVFQRKVPVIVTFHGCDINESKSRLISKYFVSPLTKSNIVVNETMLPYLPSNKTSLIPCGIDLEQLPIIDIVEAKNKLGLDIHKRYILFSSSFDRTEKNATLAFEALKIAKVPDVELLEFKNYTYDSIRYLFNAVDVALLSSIREGSPQFIKEAMACNCAIVATRVGDIKWVIGNVEGCYLTSFDPKDMAEKIKLALNFSRTKKRTNGRKRILDLGLDCQTIANRIIEVYKKVLKQIEVCVESQG